MKTSLILWIVTLIICSFILTFYAHVWNTSGTVMLITDILLGIFLYISFILKLEKKLKVLFGIGVGPLISVVAFLFSLIAGMALIFGVFALNTNYLKLKPLMVSKTRTSTQSKERLVFDQVQIGSNGDDVSMLQLLLSQDKAVYSGPISGYFGTLTKDGVMKFQKKYGFEETGVADIVTRNKISEIYSYQTREYWLGMIRLMPTTASADNFSDNSSRGKWGVSERVEGTEHGWAMRVNNDTTMASAQEIFDALNAYRSKKGIRGLNWDGNLASFALERANFYKANGLDDHAGFMSYINNDDNRRKLGFRGIGENGSIGYRMTGTHIIEWVFASDAPHDNNQVDPDWSDVGIGVSGTGVDIIFGSNRF